MEDMSLNKIKMSDFFDCTQCGDCCTGHGGTYVDEKKIAEIADFLEITPEKVKSDYLTLSSEQRYMIASGKNGKCVFFKENCSIHPVKPRMCREWPFIPAVLREKDNWMQMSGACPGIIKNVDFPRLKQFILKSLEDTRPISDIKKLKVS